MDIFIADSGRPIRNNSMITWVSPVGSSTIQSRQTDINAGVSYPSGYGGNVKPSIYYSRFDDLGYYTSVHSGYVYGGPTTRDLRQT